MVLTYPSDAIVLVAGVPGAGKSTLVARVAGEEVRTLDSDPVRRRLHRRLGRLPYRVWRPLVHSIHGVSVWRALATPGPLIIAEPATRRISRRALLRRAPRTGRSVHLLGIDATVAEARAGQLARGRTISSASLRRHAEGWAALRCTARSEGFATVRFFRRDAAARIERLAFAAQAAQTPPPALAA
jgi:predicted kinase